METHGNKLSYNLLLNYFEYTTVFCIVKDLIIRDRIKNSESHFIGNFALTFLERLGIAHF